VCLVQGSTRKATFPPVTLYNLLGRSYYLQVVQICYKNHYYQWPDLSGSFLRASILLSSLKSNPWKSAKLRPYFLFCLLIKSVQFKTLRVFET